MDETNAAVGVAVTVGGLTPEVAALLRRVQNDLFDVGADLCTPLAPAYDHPPLRVQEPWVGELEAACDTYNEPLAPSMHSWMVAPHTPGKLSESA